MFKKITPCIIIVLLIAGCHQNKNPYINKLGVAPSFLATFDTANYTLIEWKDSVINFGTLKVGDSVHLKFGFKNIGETPLFIVKARSSCGCTITQFPEEPVMPGKSNFIYATLKSGTHTGEINKTIMVESNTKNKMNHLLIIRGYIKAADTSKQSLN